MAKTINDTSKFRLYHKKVAGSNLKLTGTTDNIFRDTFWKTAIRLKLTAKRGYSVDIENILSNYKTFTGSFRDEFLKKKVDIAIANSYIEHFEQWLLTKKIK